MTIDVASALGRHERLNRTELADALRSYGTQSVTHLRSGLEADVYLCETRRYGKVVVKMPFTRQINNDNDQGIDSRDLLIQEATLLRYGRTHQFPVPEVLDLVLVDSQTAPDYLIMAFVETDELPLRPSELGRVLRRLHDLPTPPLRCVAQRDDTCARTICTAIRSRADVIERFIGQPLQLPTADEMWARVADDFNRPQSLLHMDFRDANLLARRGSIVAVIDWSNALIGPRELELARVSEYGVVDDEFVAGYGSHPFWRSSSAFDITCRLYTATMLSVVFLSEAPDPTRAPKYVSRVKELAQLLSAALR